MSRASGLALGPGRPNRRVYSAILIRKVFSYSIDHGISFFRVLDDLVIYQSLQNRRNKFAPNQTFWMGKALLKPVDDFCRQSAALLVRSLLQSITQINGETEVHLGVIGSHG